MSTVATNFDDLMLMKAVDQGDVNKVRRLIRLMSRVNVWVCSIVHYACKKGHLDMVRMLIVEFRADAYVNCNGWTLLHSACSEGQLDMARMLIAEFRTDVNCVKSYMCTPLHYACSGGHLDMVRMLIAEFRADVNCIDSRGLTPLHYACSGGHLDMVRMLIAEFRADVNCADSSGWTPLHYACSKGHLDMVRMLIAEFRTDVNCIDSLGKTPLDLAGKKMHNIIIILIKKFLADSECTSVCRGSNEWYMITIRMLIVKFNVDVNFADSNGDTLLHGGCSKGDLDMVRMLLAEFRANVNCIDSRGWTPLHYACSGGHMDMVRSLIAEFKADVSCINSIGRTPLHYACSKGHLDMIRMLIADFKADVNCPDSSGWTPLHYACSKGHFNIVRMLIAEFKADVNCIDSSGWTPLHWACIGHLDIVGMLIAEFKADVNCPDSSGWTPLHYACREGQWDIVRMLITEFKADVSCIDSSGLTPLHYACSKGHLDIVRMLIAEFKADVNCIDSRGRTPLHYACKEGQWDTVRILIAEFKADVNCPDSSGWTPLHYACSKGHLDMVRMLIAEFKANVNCIDSSGWTPLHYACREGQWDIVRMLIAELKADVSCIDSRGRTPLHYACREGQWDIVRMLIVEFKAEVNCPDSRGWTPLHYAGHLDMVRMLIAEFKANVNCIDYSGWTPLHYACREGQWDIVRMLIAEFKADVSCTDSCGWTPPLLYACSEGQWDIVRMLIAEFKADINCIDSSGCTPLHYACREGQWDIVRMLIAEFKADVSCIDSHGWTPLHYACREGQWDIVRMLIAEFKADVNCPDSREWTPLHYACSKGHLDMVRMLIAEFKANVNCTDSSGWTPLHYACSKGKLEMTRMLIAEFHSDITCNNIESSTPLQIAVTFDQERVALALIREFGCSTSVKDNLGRSVLHCACIRGNASLVRALCEDISPLVVDDDGNTPLHLSSLLKGDSDCVQVLLQSNAPVLVRNKSGKTPIDIATGEAKALLDEYMKSNQDNLYRHYDALQECAKKRYSSAEHITRVFVIGNPGAGKSSLVQTLKKEGFFKSLWRVTKDSVPLHTAGIIPSVHTSKHYGRALFYDFAGDPEYYSSHAAILENIASSSKGDNIFIIVIDLSKDHVRIKDILGYWFSFVQYQKFNTRKPFLIAIGSHYDLLDKRTVEVSKMKFQEFRESDTFCFFLLDCCKPQSKGIHQLTSHITSLTKDSPRYELSLQASILLGLLEKDFSNVTACSVEDVISHIHLTHVSLPDDSASLLPVLEKLHDIGVLFVIGGSSHGNLQIVLNISQLTQDVHKLLFSEESKLKKSFTDIGILPQSFLKELLPEHITKECLIHLQYCQEISHKDVGAFHLPLTLSHQSLLFFPALCSLKRSDISWITPPGLSYSIGWLARCTVPLDYFPPRFLHVLLLKLVFKFTLSAPTESQASADLRYFQRRCTMWKAGVHWLMEEGVECMVELANFHGKNNGVTVITRSDRETTENCIKVFNRIINCVMQAKAEFCHSIQPDFFLVDSTEASSNLKEDNLFAMSEVERVLNSLEGKTQVISITGKKVMKLEEIVCLRKCTHWDNLFHVDFTTVLHHLREVDRDLYNLGLHLHLPACHLRAIELDFPTDTDRRRRELVWRWLSSSRDPPCWWRLVQALKTIDHNVSAREIETAYGKS